MTTTNTTATTTMTKQHGIIVPGSVITKKTAPDYLRRVYARTFMETPSMESSVFIDDIENRIVSAGFLTWEECEAIEIEAMKEVDGQAA